MHTLLVPGPVREKLGDEGSDGLVMMFAEAHRIGTDQLDRRIAEVSASFEHRLNDELSKFRLEMTRQMSDLRFDLLKWNFLFWVGQLAAIIAILGVMLRDVR
jgi:hypothetical protein